jgi:hypothetical protein
LNILPDASDGRVPKSYYAWGFIYGRLDLDAFAWINAEFVITQVFHSASPFLLAAVNSTPVLSPGATIISVSPPPTIPLSISSTIPMVMLEGKDCWIFHNAYY